MHLDINATIQLENAHVRLEPLTLAHLPALLPIALQYPNLLQYSPSHFGTESHLKSYIETALAARKKGNRYAFAIFDKTKNVYAGSTSFGNISNENKRIEIGWTWIGESFQGTDLNRNCKFLLMSYAFETLEFVRVELKTDSRNIASRKAIEKIGGVYEGELRSHTLMTDGYRRDTVYYSILQQEWAAIKAGYFAELSTK